MNEERLLRGDVARAKYKKMKDLFMLIWIRLIELWCWRRLLKLPWTARRSKQPSLSEINPEYSLEGLKLKLKLQYLDHLMQTDNSLEKSLMLGNIEGRRRRGCQRIR